METGIVANSNAEYHGGPGISSSGLKLLQISPAHYWARYLDPDREEREQSRALIIGSAIHTATLEPDEFEKRYAVVPEGIDRRSKEGKALFAEIEAAGIVPLSQADAKLTQRTSAAMRRHPVGKRLLELPGLVEHSIYWRDAETGVLCKCRPDKHIPPCADFPNGLIFDLKSAEDADVDGFTRASYNYGYHIAAAFYSEGFQIAYGTADPPPFILGVVEKESPFAVRFYSAGAGQEEVDGEGGISPLQLGGQIVHSLLPIYASCLKSNVWPGYPVDIATLSLPGWVKKQFADDIEDIEEIGYV
jgi:exodeoxyribonuclease VIII